MPKPHQTLRQLLRIARQPRPAAAVYEDFTRLQQVYILEQCAAHFGIRADDPAPLFRRSLLDVGAGQGGIAEFLALSGATITALEADPKAFASAKARAEAFGMENMTILRQTPESLLPSLQTFDVIVVTDALTNSTNPAKLLWVLKQLLAPGGLMILSAIQRSPRAWVYHVLLGRWLYRRRKAKVNLNFFTILQLKQLCGRAGLTLSPVQGLRFSFLKQRWKKARTPQTRFLATATVA
jgi:2-polyprenyl-6-hydroxyphenyl methylase / 3-demethylubiquinone-9 3-methyltransferase